MTVDGLCNSVFGLASSKNSQRRTENKKKYFSKYEHNIIEKTLNLNNLSLRTVTIF